MKYTSFKLGRQGALCATLLLSGISFGQTVQSEPHKVALENPSTSAPTVANAKKNILGLPDGVLNVKVNEDGSFKSLVVKATVEIEDVLGASKGKSLARSEAEVECKRALAKWLDSNCLFAEAQNKSVTIITKGDSAKDAAGNVVKLKTQSGEETKIRTESSASTAKAVLRGLTVLQSNVTAKGEYVLVMGLSATTLDQAAKVKSALSTRTQAAPQSPRQTPAPGVKKAINNDLPAAESKVNPAINEFM